ncbi:RNA-directed DNA polymerase, eukaryota [Tanacetum coccineum]
MSSIRQNEKRQIKIPSKLVDSDYGTMNAKNNRNKKKKNLNNDVMCNDGLESKQDENLRKMDECQTEVNIEIVEEVRDVNEINKESDDVEKTCIVNENDETWDINGINTQKDEKRSITINIGCSKEDQTIQISKTVFVTNFPDHIRARDLWGLCKKYGSVVDVYIPFKKSKAGNDRLSNVTYSGNIKGSFASILKEGIQKQSVPTPSQPALVLNDSCLKERDFNNSLMGQVKEVTAIPNLYTILSEESFQSAKLTYLGGLLVLIGFDSLDILEKFCNHVGLPINACTTNMFSKIASKWGDLVVWEESEENFLSRKHLCLKSKVHVLINECFKIIIKGKVYWIRAKEPDAWVLKFISDSDSSYSEEGFYESDEESKFKDKDLDNVKGDSDVEKVSETSGMQENEIGNDNEHSIRGEENLHSSDPFNIYELLQKKKDNIHQTKESDPTHSPGFTPELGNNKKEEGSNSINDQRKSVSGKKILSYHNVEASAHHTTYMPITGGSILDVMDDLVKVGQTMRWDGETVVMGDFNEVRTEQERFGSTFNIQGDNASNNFIYLAGLVDLHLGGYSYTWAHKSASKMSKLDRFLISKDLLYLFPHLLGLCLDRHLSDHRPIIMFESKLDYGPIPFRMFHSWFKMEGFGKFVKDTWDSMNVMDSNGLIRKKKLQLLKNSIKSWVKEKKNSMNEANFSIKCKLTEVDKLLDRGEGDAEIRIQRASLLKDLNDITSNEALDLSQKAKFR